MFITLSKKSTIFIKSVSLKPLVVKAGVPNLIPPGIKADLSPGTEFLFRDISTNSHIFLFYCQIYFYLLNQ